MSLFLELYGMDSDDMLENYVYETDTERPGGRLQQRWVLSDLCFSYGICLLFLCFATFIFIKFSIFVSVMILDIRVMMGIDST